MKISFDRNALYGYISMVVSCLCYFLLTSLYSRSIPSYVFANYFLFYNIFSQTKNILSHLFLNSNQGIFLQAILAEDYHYIKFLLKKLLYRIWFLGFFVLYLTKIFLVKEIYYCDIFNIAFLSFVNALGSCFCFVVVAQNNINLYFLALMIENITLLSLNIIFTKTITSVSSIIFLMACASNVSCFILFLAVKKYFRRCYRRTYTPRSVQALVHVNKYNLFLDITIFFLNTPALIAPYFLSQKNIVLFFATFRLYELSCMVVQKYLDSQQGRIMQSAYASYDIAKSLCYTLFKRHMALSLLAFFALCLLGKFLIQVWLGFSVNYFIILIIAITGLIKNIKLFLYQFLICYRNEFCKHLLKLNSIEVSVLFCLFMSIWPTTIQTFYLIYIIGLGVSLCCFLRLYLKLSSTKLSLPH